MAPSTSEVIDVRSPATGELVGRVPLAAATDVDAACAAARTAFDQGPWPHMTPAQHAAVLAKAVALLQDSAEDFKRILALETGQPPTIIDMMQYGSGLASLQYFAGAADDFVWRGIREGVYARPW